MAEKKLTLITVDNGWGIQEFEDISSRFSDLRRIVVRKGATSLRGLTTAEVVEYDRLAEVMAEADIALFSKVGAANADDYRKILEAGIPTIVQVQYQQDRIEHEKNGWVYGVEQWAIHWIANVVGNPDERKRIREYWTNRETVALADDVVVSVITPTWRRDPQVVSRNLDCMALQTMSSWEQVVCSDGEDEPEIRALIEGRKDVRYQYRNTTGRKDGDFGNTVRSEMLQAARGKYTLFYDDDNVILPNYLEQMVGALEGSPECVMAVCHVMHFGPLNEAIIGKPPQVLTGLPVKLFHIDTLQVLVRTDIAKKCGWDTEHGYIADGYSLEKFGKAGAVVEVAEVLGVHL